MFVLFEEAGKYQGGRVLSQADASSQVELTSGKRLKVKAANIVLAFEAPEPAALIAEARALAAEIDLDLAWEFASEEEFGFTALASDYFGGKPTVAQQAAALFALFEAPHYFRRAGKGKFRKAPLETVQLALAAIEKKKLLQAQIDEWAAALVAGTCPEPVRAQLYKILFKPDRNAAEYKAVVEAARASQRNPLELLASAGAIASSYEFHWQRFLFENFARGTGFPALAAPAAVGADLPLADVQAFSIDDSQTTEIDDALSVSGLDDGSTTVTVGIHIAAPGLAFGPGDPIDAVARQRLSTVYMPGHKVTMLPDAVVDAFTLEAGRDCPALSLYVRFDAETLAIEGSETRIERVPIAANLRHDQLDASVTNSWLTGSEDLEEKGLELLSGVRRQLSFLYRLARHLKAQREHVRGKPENFNRPDYNFRLVGAQSANGEPDGSEQVEITTRRRGAPLDLIVSEAMILANSTWGSWLGELGVPGIYRSQASLAPGVKVKMGTKPAPHAGIGVKSYAWSTSPLRRYTDLVNQWQLIAAARHGATAALAAPFKPKDAELFSVVSAFDAAYAAYNAHQSGMERFWTLKYLQQRGIDELEVTAIKELPNAVLVRADTLPLVFPVTGALPRGARARVRLGAIDEIALDLHGTVVERLDTPAGDDAEDDMSEDETSSGALAIAVDLGDAAEGDESPASPAKPAAELPA